MAQGKTGIGKSYLGAALAQAACHGGLRAMCTRVPRLAHELTIARADGTHTAMLALLARFDVREVADGREEVSREGCRRALPARTPRHIDCVFCRAKRARRRFFVVTDALKSQQDAQARAALVGGWVLDTDAYTALAPGLFAVVQGPYSSRPIADQRLKELKAIKTYKAAYVKEAGALRRTHIRQVRTA